MKQILQKEEEDACSRDRHQRVEHGCASEARQPHVLVAVVLGEHGPGDLAHRICEGRALAAEQESVTCAGGGIGSCGAWRACVCARARACVVVLVCVVRRACVQWV